jgi:hypothetical protein
MTTKQLDDMAWFEHPFTYRNNRGACKTADGRFLRFGIPEPPVRGKKDSLKGGDRIGFTEVKITADMVGETLAVFTNVEIKGPGDKLKQGQIDWHNFILQHGGISKIYKPKEVVKDEIL